jgi:hypothetical protein
VLTCLGMPFMQNTTSICLLRSLGKRLDRAGVIHLLPLASKRQRDETTYKSGYMGWVCSVCRKCPGQWIPFLDLFRRVLCME